MAESRARKRAPRGAADPSERSLDRALGKLVAAGAAGALASGAGVQELVRRDLAEVREGRAVATAAGRARATRASGGAEPFLAQHTALGRRRVLTESGAESLLVDLEESPLAWLARRKGRDGRPLLSPIAVAAGEKLRADFTRGQMTPRVTANWEASVSRGRRGGGGSVAEIADAAIAARGRVTRAVEAVGPELSGALLDVCCFLKGVEEVERERGWPARGAKLVLGLALTRLARHYGLDAVGDGGRARRGVDDGRCKADDRRRVNPPDAGRLSWRSRVPRRASQRLRA